VKPARFHPEAEAELTAAIAYYEGQRAGLGASLLKAVEAAVLVIRQNPAMFPAKGPDGTRKCPVRRFPYAVHYLELDDEVWIAAVAHQEPEAGLLEGAFPVIGATGRTLINPSNRRAAPGAGSWA
jgi:toxin ParE1/3/4